MAEGLGVNDMKRFIRMAVLAGGASLLAAGPVFAQDLNALNPLTGLGIDLDPFHIFTPAPPPPPAGVPPAPGPARGHRHHHLHAAAHHHAAGHAHRHGGGHHAAHGAVAKKG